MCDKFLFHVLDVLLFGGFNATNKQTKKFPGVQVHSVLWLLAAGNRAETTALLCT